MDEDEENAEELARKEFEEGGGLPEQPENPDFNELTPLSPEIINRQATINIGTIGHVAHGSLLLSGLSLVSRPFVSRMN